MMNNPTNFSFTYSSHNDENNESYPISTTNSKDITLSDTAPWPVVLREFANFLSGIYGYDIATQVFIKDGHPISLGDNTEQPEYYSVSDYQ